MKVKIKFPIWNMYVSINTDIDNIPCVGADFRIEEEWRRSQEVKAQINDDDYDIYCEKKIDCLDELVYTVDQILYSAKEIEIILEFIPKYRIVLYGWGEEFEVDPINISKTLAQNIHIGTYISDEFLEQIYTYSEFFSPYFVENIKKEVARGKHWFVDRIEVIDNFEYSNGIYFDYILNAK